MSQRVLLARIGWMKYYGRLDDAADRLIGGGRYNEGATGSEVFNFKVVDGRVYGYVRPTQSQHISLNRLIPEFPRALIVLVMYS